MSFLMDGAYAEVACRIGWTLLHSLWQCALVALVSAVALQALRRRSANSRYAVACAGMATMLAGFVATFIFLSSLEQNEGNTATAVMDRQLGSVPQTASTELSVRQAAPPVSHRIRPEGAMVEGPKAGGMGQEDRSKLLASAAQPATAVPWASLFGERAASALTPWLPWIAAAWLAGVVWLSIWNVGGWLTAQRLRLMGVSPVEPDIAGRFSQLVDRMDLSRTVQLLRSAVVEAPITVGWLRPTILLPLGVITGLTPSELDAIIIHELAHIRRHDYLVNLLQTVIETLLFYHPAVWWLSRRTRIERENCCDDWAVAATGNSLSYARMLTRFGELCDTGDRCLPDGQAVSARGGTLLGRVRRLLDSPSRKSNSPWHLAAAVLVLGALSVSILFLAFDSGSQRTSAADRSAVQQNRPTPVKPVPSTHSVSEQPAGRTDVVEGPWGKETDSLQSRIILPHRRFKQGEPIEPRVVVRNVGDEPIPYDLGRARWDAVSGISRFEVIGPADARVAGIAPSAQTEMDLDDDSLPVLKPGAEITVPSNRLDTHHYMRAPGRYRIRWTGLDPMRGKAAVGRFKAGLLREEGADVADRRARSLPPSASVEIDVVPVPGGGPDGDLVGRLLKILPPGWKVAGATLLADDVKPTGRTAGRGSTVGLIHRPFPGLLPNTAGMRLYVMDAASAPNSGTADTSPAGHLGQGKLGHVYLAYWRHTDPLARWNNAPHDIAFALDVSGSMPQPSPVDWGSLACHILQACSSEGRRNGALRRFCCRSQISSDTNHLLKIFYRSNAAASRDDGKAEFAREDPDQPYYYVNISVKPAAPEGQQRLMPVDKSIEWDGESNARGYKVGRPGVQIRITVASDDERFRQTLNAILDRQVTSVLTTRVASSGGQESVETSVASADPTLHSGWRRGTPADVGPAIRSPDKVAVAGVSREMAGRSDGAVSVEVKAVDTSRHIAVSVRSEKREWKVGDEIPFTFTVSNQGDCSAWFIDWEPDRSGGWGVYRFNVLDEPDRLVPDPLGEDRVYGLADMFGREVELQPGKSYSRTIPVNRWAMLTKPGTYKVIPIIDNLRPGQSFPGGFPDPRTKDRSKALERLSAAHAVPLGARPEAEWPRIARIWPVPNFINLDLELPPITLTVRPRSDAEMAAYVQDLGRQLAAANRRSTRAPLIRKLIFTCDRRAVPILLEEAYRPGTSNYWVNEGFLYYLPRDRETTQAMLKTAAKRGMSRGMLWALEHRGCTEKDIKPLIDVSLAPENPHTWADGAAAAKLYPADRFVPRLIALATRDVDARLPERQQAIYALALHRTDESVTTLKRLLEDRDRWAHATAWGAVRSAWHFRSVTRGRPLREEDFDARYRQPY